MMKPAGGASLGSLVCIGMFGLAASCLLAMIGNKAHEPADHPALEAELRWTANPFPAEP
jgi:hypothetical protein